MLRIGVWGMAEIHTGQCQRLALLVIPARIHMHRQGNVLSRIEQPQIARSLLIGQRKGLLLCIREDDATVIVSFAASDDICLAQTCERAPAWFAGADDTPGGVRQGITVFSGLVLQTDVKTHLTWFRYCCLVWQCRVGLCRIVESSMLTGARFTRTLRQPDCQPGTLPCRAARIDPNNRPIESDATGVQLEEAAAASGSELHTGVDDDLVTGVIMNLPPCLDELALTEFDVLVVGDGQVVVGLDLGPAVGVGSVVFFGQVLGVAVGFDAFVPFVADTDFLVVLDVLIPVALGVDEDLLLAGLVLDAQFVEAVAAGTAQALEQAADLVCRQLVGHRMGTVVQTAGDQWLVRVAFQKTDQYFHADARDGHAAPVVAGPAAGHPQPAAGVGIGLAFAVPVELDLDPALVVAVDFFAGRAGDHRGLLAQHPGFGVAQGWAVGGVPGGGLEVVAVALSEGCFPLSPRGRGLGRGGIIGARRFCAGYGLFQNLRLFAFVVNVGDQPEVVPAVSRVALQFEEVAAAQSRLVAEAGSLAVVAAVTLEAALGQVLAAAAVGEAAGVVVVFQVGQLLTAGLTFQQQASLVGVVVAAGDAAGAGFQADAEALDHRLIGDHAVALIKAGGRQSREHRLVVAEHQVMAVRAVAEVVVDALFLAQTLDEVQVGLVVLGAVVALGIVNTELEAVGIALDTVIGQHPADDLGYRQVLEDALIVAQGQVMQVRYQLQAVAGHALAGLADGGVVNQAVQASALAFAMLNTQPGIALQQGLQIQVWLVADQLHFDAVALADGFVSAEGQHPEVVLEAGQVQGEVGFIGGGKHPQVLVQ